MKRREFLQRTGAVVAGGTAAWSAAGGDLPAGTEANSDRQRVLVTGAENELARQIAASLADSWAVQVTSTEKVDTDLPFTLCSLESEAEVQPLLQGVAAIVHAGCAASADQERPQTGQATRRTYHLLQGAVAAGVGRVVYLSSLDLLDNVDSQYLVDEDFQPQAMTGTGQLVRQLEEVCCREFARSRRLQVVVLRLAALIQQNAPEASEKGSPVVTVRDAIGAVRLALETEQISDGRGIETWSVFHILSNPDQTRFPIQRAKRLLGYSPRS
jgi:nucleoside-diphosphate-sugar epimerase